MEREILFRGKTKSEGKWIYGMPTYDFEYIFNDDNLDSPGYEVEPETIGLFSTIYDKNKKRIFEGDIFKLGSEKDLFEVRFVYGCFLAYLKGKQFGILGELHTCFIEVVGNIYANPELIENNYNNKK